MNYLSGWSWNFLKGNSERSFAMRRLSTKTKEDKRSFEGVSWFMNVLLSFDESQLGQQPRSFDEKVSLETNQTCVYQNQRWVNRLSVNTKIK